MYPLQRIPFVSITQVRSFYPKHRCTCTRSSEPSMNTYYPRLPNGAKQKLPSLLHMEYKVAELAEEIGITPKTIYSRYIPAGLPHRRDNSGNIWIVGTEFAKWINEALKNKPAPVKLADNEGYCARCKQPRPFSAMELKRVLSAGRASYVGLCSVCGATMTVIRRTHDQP